MMLMPIGNRTKYEVSEKCSILFVAHPVDWKQKADIPKVPGIYTEDIWEFD